MPAERSGAVVTARIWIAIALAFGLVLLVWTLSSCEPCAVVLTGHCEEKQHDEEKMPGSILEPPAPLYVPHSRG